MDITRAALVNNRTTVVLLIVIVLAGVQAFISMPRAYDPGFIIRTAQVITHFPGAGPERVEELVTDRIERAVQEIPEVDFIKSESRTGTSIVLVNIRENYRDMRPIWDNLRRKIDDVADDLPDGVVGPDVNDEFGDVYGIVVALTGEGFTPAELSDVAEDVRSELLRIADVAKVELYGAQEERVFVEYSNARLTELELSPSQLAQIIAGRNIVSPGGSIRIADERIELEPTGNFESIEDIRRTIIQVPGSSTLLYLEDIADVARGYADPPSVMVRASGQDAIAIAVSMREGGNNIEMGREVSETLDRLQSSYPIGLDFHVINFSPEEVKEKVRGFVSNLVQAVCVVTIVMLVTLGMRTGLVVASLIPLSMLMTILVMSFLEIGLDQISLAALIIALGMLVDNGIVMSENIMVQVSAGRKAFDAALDSAAELRVPLLTSSLTTAAAFLPIYLAESSTGEFTASLFKVVSITLLCSWLLALTAIPLLCVRFLKTGRPQTDFQNAPYRRYRATLGFLLRHRAATMFALFLFVGVAAALSGIVPRLFFPPSDRTYFKMEFELPRGTAIERTSDAVEVLEDYISGTLAAGDGRAEGVTSWITYTGSSGPRFLLSHNPKAVGPNFALLILNVTSEEVIDDLMQSLDEYAFEQFPDASIKIKRFENGPSIENPFELRLLGKETGTLFRNVEQVEAGLRGTAGLKPVSDDWGPFIKKLVVNINQANALRSGVTSQDIAVSLQTALSGVELTEYREGDAVIPVMMRSSQGAGIDMEKLEALSVYAQATGQSVPLAQVADIRLFWEPANIFRRDRLKTVTLGAQLEPGVTITEVLDRAIPQIERLQDDWGVGYRYEVGGEAETSGKANQSIVEKLPAAAFIIAILLVAQFNSLRKTLIILLTIPLGIIGVIIGLAAMRSYFGFMTLLGVISLAGIVINNAIVLLEKIQQQLDAGGGDPIQAIVEASQSRLRPILLTTATTVLGLMPLYLGGGAMWEPMAIAIMAGLLFSTLLTLGVVPVLYAIFFRIRVPDDL